jgi:myo-inositol-1(or 4)-monophosphatase
MDDTELLDVALIAARAAAEIHSVEAGRIAPADWEEKGVFDFVSRADRDAERRIIETVKARFPDHAFLAEESTVPQASLGPATAGDAAEWVWIVDPLDGTTNFLHRYPMYCASVAVAHRGELVVGAVAAATGDEWTAVRGAGARHNGRPIHVSRISELRHALVGTGFPFRAPDRIPAYLEQFQRVLRHASGVRRAGSAALDLCHVATGWFDGFWELVLAPWDIAAGTLIVREAGGRVTTLNGSPHVLAGGAVLAGNPAIHDALRRLVDEAGVEESERH